MLLSGYSHIGTRWRQLEMLLLQFLFSSFPASLLGLLLGQIPFNKGKVLIRNLFKLNGNVTSKFQSLTSVRT